MRNSINRFWQYTLLLICFTGLIQAQETIPAAGGDVEGSGTTLSYSVGQLYYSIISDTEGSVTPGVQQAYEISIVSGIEDAEWVNLSIKTYPNPTKEYIILKIEQADISNYAVYKYQVIDLTGKILQSKNIEESETVINMNENVPSTYILRVIENENILKTFKIIKN